MQNRHLRGPLQINPCKAIHVVQEKLEIDWIGTTHNHLRVPGKPRQNQQQRLIR